MSKVKEIKEALFKQIDDIAKGDNDETTMLNIEKVKATCMIVNTLCNISKTEIALSNFNRANNGNKPLNKNLLIEA